ncbi:MAG: hypothetical protein ACRC6U_10620 [Fusobacteriaceae bacterium]
MVRKSKTNKKQKLKKFSEENNIKYNLTCDCLKDLSIITENYCHNGIVIENSLILKCSECGKRYLPPLTSELFLIIENIKNNNNITKFNFDKIYSMAKKDYPLNINMDLPYLYSESDYYGIPGLIRNQGAYLMPVYFNKEVLIKYIYNPEYEFDFTSTDYFSIIKKEEFVLPIGINKNGKVIAWLGDILKLPKKEQYYLLSENIKPDNELNSQFYRAQINLEWPEPSIEARIMNLRTKFNETLKNKYSITLSNLDIETLNKFKEYKRPLNNTNLEFNFSMISLNQIFIETLNKKELIHALETMEKNIKLQGIPVKKQLKDLGTMVLLKILIINLFKFPEDEAKNLMTPFVIINDLRQVGGHLLPCETINKFWSNAKTSLKLTDDTPLSQIYDVLIERLHNSYQKFCSTVETLI